MRRLLAALVVSVFAGMICAPALLAMIPASAHTCCLRAGAHHCSESGASGEGFQKQSGKCPYKCCSSAPAGLAYLSTAPESRFHFTVRDLVLRKAVGESYLLLSSSIFERGPPDRL